MNRKIKFRYRYTDGKNWIMQVFTLVEIANGAPFEVLSDNPLLKNYKHVGEDEFTGLLDKNRKEIFEGDKCIANSGIIGEIVFKNGRFAWTDGACHWDIIDFSKIEKRDSIADKFEVIGNIYDNPEILKK
jgi:hypothetical protein